jgi:hypothetical protein
MEVEMVQDSKTGYGLNLDDLKKVAKKMVSMLENKTFFVVSYHSKPGEHPKVLEDRKLKSSDIIVKGTLIKMLFDPSRSLSFDLSETPRILIESDKQIIVIRNLPSGDVVTRVILINGERLEEKNGNP